MTDFPKLGAPAERALANAGCTRLAQLTKITEAELSRLHGMGPNALGRLCEALTLKGLSFAKASEGIVTKKKMASPVSRTDKVDEFMKNLDHPFKAEVQVIRDFIKNANQKITEEIKWKAPSFSYNGEHLVTFNLRDTKRIHLVFHNPMISKVKSKLLEGVYTDRRMAYFADMKDVKAKKSALEKALKDLIKLQEKRRTHEKDRSGR
jgi:uncharacterized protein YdhG (YjbR/CyaY superfamily)